MNTYIEITKSDHNHGGHGWEFGTCLWSPTRNRIGHDRYSLMREPVAGDRVIHFYNARWPDGNTDNRVAGQSIVEIPYTEVNYEPPEPGNWGGLQTYYRIELHNYTPYQSPLPITTLLSEYAHDIMSDLLAYNNNFYPFTIQNNRLRTNQGIYLARCSETLFNILRVALSISEAGARSGNAQPTNAEYIEGRRLSKERYFFARNPNLAREVKRISDYKCRACGFKFEDKYGELGYEYIEVHHLDPLSERPEALWSDEVRTRLDRVAVLCSNCHRMIHRRRPALTIEELQKLLTEN